MNKLMNSDPQGVLIDAFDRGRSLRPEDLFHCVTLETRETENAVVKNWKHLRGWEKCRAVGFKGEVERRKKSVTNISSCKATNRTHVTQ